MGLRIRMGGTTILVDYFAFDLPGRRVPAPIPLAEVTGVDGFTGTHDHLDHIDHEAWRSWRSICRDAKFVFPSVHRGRFSTMASRKNGSCPSMRGRA